MTKIITVHGNVEFPIDMLRYDNAWSRTETDSHKIRASYDGGMGYQQIQVVTGDINAPNRNRWLSFGWKVIKIETVK